MTARNEPPEAVDRALPRLVEEAYDGIDPVPPGLVDRLKEAITLQALFADLEWLGTGDVDSASSRTASGQRQTLSFAGHDLALLVTLTATRPSRLRLDGWLWPGPGWHVLAMPIAPGVGTTAELSDPDGRFGFADLPAEPFRLVLTAADPQRGVTTPVIAPASAENPA